MDLILRGWFTIRACVSIHGLWCGAKSSFGVTVVSCSRQAKQSDAMAEAAEAESAAVKERLETSLEGFRGELSRLHTERRSVRTLLALLVRAVVRRLTFRAGKARRERLTQEDLRLSLERSGVPERALTAA
jgi:hypothetical protein